MHRVRCFPHSRSGHTACIRGTSFSLGHVATPRRLMLRDGELFAAQPETSPLAQRLYLVTRGTPISRYRQWPPGPPQGRVRACRWGQDLYHA